MRLTTAAALFIELLRDVIEAMNIGSVDSQSVELVDGTIVLTPARDADLIVSQLSFRVSREGSAMSRYKFSSDGRR